MNIASFAPLAVVLPILGAALTFLLIRHSRAQRLVSIALLSLTLLLECLLLAAVWNGGTDDIRCLLPAARRSHDEHDEPCADENAERQ